MTLRTCIGTRRIRRRAFLKMLWPPDTLGTADTDEQAARFAALVGRDLADQPPILRKQVKALSRHDTSNRLDELAAIPTFVLSAKHDSIAPPCYGRMLVAAIPGARFEQMTAFS